MKRTYNIIDATLREGEQNRGIWDLLGQPPRCPWRKINKVWPYISEFSIQFTVQQIQILWVLAPVQLLRRKADSISVRSISSSLFRISVGFNSYIEVCRRKLPSYRHVAPD